MELAATLDPERLRDIMSAVFNRSALVVRRYGGTVDKFTGDGIMALFGAPVRVGGPRLSRAACAPWTFNTRSLRWPAEPHGRDGIDLRLRIGAGLRSESIVGDIDSGPGVTAIGVHVGMAQRMESAARLRGVMISETTARIWSATSPCFGEPEMVRTSKAPIRPSPRIACSVPAIPDAIVDTTPPWSGGPGN